MRILLIVERLKQNKTQKQVADAIGISTQMLSKYEKNKIQPMYKNMKKISDYYGLSVETLFGEDINDEMEGDK